MEQGMTKDATTESMSSMDRIIDYLRHLPGMPLESPERSASERLQSHALWTLAEPRQGTVYRCPRSRIAQRAKRIVKPKLGLSAADYDSLFLIDPPTMSAELTERIRNGVANLSDAARVFTFARDSGEINWELAVPKSAEWAAHHTHSLLSLRLPILSREDREYIYDMRDVVRHYAKGRAAIYDVKGAGPRSDAYPVLVLATDEGDDAPSWRMLPETLSEDDIADLSAESLRNMSSRISRSYISRLVSERDESLRTARFHMEEGARIVHAQGDVRLSFLARGVNTDENPPQLQHDWLSYMPAGRRPQPQEEKPS